MNKDEKEMLISNLCTCYNKKNLEDVLYGRKPITNPLKNIKKYDKEIIREAISKYDDEKYLNERKIIRNDASNGIYTLKIKLNNFTREMDSNELEEYIERILRHAGLEIEELEFL